MSDILSEIDDTLADWHGSADSMRWAPDGAPAGAFKDALRQQILDAYQIPNQLRRAWNLVPEVWPHRDYILDLSGVSLTPGTVVVVDGITEMERLRVIEGPPLGPWRVRPVPERPKRLDARYRQRQKNRRKRKQ